jgi:cellulose synthase (UDP-forming)
MKKKIKLPTGEVAKKLLVVNIIASIVYLGWWFSLANMGNVYLYGLLVFGEVYHVGMALFFWHTVWPRKKRVDSNYETSDFVPSVDVFVPVAGEPIEVIRRTVQAAKNLDYAKFKVYILNDGFVAKKDNWQQVEILADQLGVRCITRKIPGGAKAGNINNALRKTRGEIVVIFDSDMAPSTSFIKKVINYFRDPGVGFVQTPQFYENSNSSPVTKAAWEQQRFFFGPILENKDNMNSAFICGTNVAIRRTALLEAGGMCENNIAEDFLTSLFIHQKGWKSHYVNEVLVKGLGPEDMLAYTKQQNRWARGSLEVLFGQNPIFKRGLTFNQRIQYISSAAFYLNGLIVFIDMAIPVIFLLTGIAAVRVNTINFAFFFLPFMILNMMTLGMVSKSRLTLRAIAFTHSSFYLQLQALRDVLLRRKTTFAVTPKNKQTGNFLYIAYPHIFYTLVTFLAVFVAIHREGFNPSVVANFSWAFFNVVLFVPYITASVDFGSLYSQKLSPSTEVSKG